jgi:hypothetical protein
MEEHQPITESQNTGVAPEAEQETRVFAPRIPLSMRQDIEAVQGLTGQNVNEVGVEALALWLKTKLEDPALGAQALAEMDAEQQRLDQRRASLANILGNRAANGAVPQQPDAASSRAAGKGRKATASGAEAS